ncbi:nuclease-related domain-containing protein [Halobacillus ihumii]|uniref:nuclease-related domain-containing protein n=1 Tax=Halobacillus ihumii TaxID=2686092 RepID=UPI0013D32F14|nr:nuclease-related domain-containing protein [Halobacillus ihumii]
MIIKPRSYPLRLRKLEALQRRLPPHHPKNSLVQEALARTRAGYHGERSIDFHLNFIPHKNYLIIHDLRLFDGQHFFQMDTVLVSRKFILILEVKNISGSLYLDSDIYQLSRTLNGKEESFPDPLLQIERQQLQLSNWIQNQLSLTIPVESLVLFSNKQAVLHLKNDRDSEKVIKSEGLVNRVNVIAQRHDKVCFNVDQLNSLAYRMVQSHHEPRQSVLESFDIKEFDLVEGVICQSCLSQMSWLKGKWQCSACGTRATNSHVLALQDYACLCHPQISNKQARKYLNINSEDTVKRLLAKLGGKKIGTYKSTKYEIPLENPKR